MHSHTLAYIACITGFERLSHLSAILSVEKIASSTTHLYGTRSNQHRQMEQIQAELAEMRAQMDAKMAQFMTVIENVSRGQAELRALVEKSTEERFGFDFEDISVGQARQDQAVVNPNGNQHSRNFPPPPLPQGQGPHFIPGNAQAQQVLNHKIPESDMDRNEDQYYMPEYEESVQGEDKKYRLLEERLKSVEGQGALGMDLTDLGLVPGVKVPPKFKVLVFEKYNGTTCPKTHVRSYYRKMSVYSSDEKLLMHFFQDSLAGASLEWYMQLESIYIRSWRDLVESFVKHYCYNLDMAPNRTQLQNLTQGTNESFKEYAQKWRELAARVQPPLMERELVDMFMGTLQGPYYDRMVGSTSVGFSELVMAGEGIEAGMKMGRIQIVGASNGVDKKPFGGYP